MFGLSMRGLYKVVVAPYIDQPRIDGANTKHPEFPPEACLIT
jgi:hypothetical protein